jgi:transketolase
MDTLQEKAINTIRFLSADGVQRANSGHPGLPMGAAAMAYTIWTRHLQFNPRNPKWFNRDRFVLSGGHGSMLLYSLLHLFGYDLSLEDLTKFRQIDSITPGHPEYGLTPGVEITTGPLGQGFANGVGMAVAEAQFAAQYNRPGIKIIDHYVYAIVTDGDLMEGVASEAASFAGHQKLGKLIYLYDDNQISIDGSTDLAFTEDRKARFDAYGWHTLKVDDGNDVEKIDAAIQSAKSDTRPSLILCKTHIGYGLPTRQDTAKAHGEPPGEDELNGAKEKLNWPIGPKFHIPEDVKEFFRGYIEKGKLLELEWKSLLSRFENEFPKEASELERRIRGTLPDDWGKVLPEFPADPKGIATRVASGKAINALAENLQELTGGSADLAPSNNTWIQSSQAFQQGMRAGRNFHFGVREHGMAAIINGMAVHGGLIPYGATFLVFSDYMRGAMRVAALSHIPSIWVFTHDSIGLGEDGPTHQPVEHIASLRTIPNLTVLRPCDANETVEAWKAAIQNRQGPTALLLTRQACPIIDRFENASADHLHHGAYVLKDLGNNKPEIILVASGSEVSLILDAGKALLEKGIPSRIVSFPSWELFEKMDAAYKDTVFPKEIKPRLAVETGVAQGWEKYIGDSGRIICMHGFGASAPYQTLFNKFGFTLDNVVATAIQVLNK